MRFPIVFLTILSPLLVSVSADGDAWATCYGFSLAPGLNVDGSNTFVLSASCANGGGQVIGSELNLSVCVTNSNGNPLQINTSSSAKLGMPFLHDSNVDHSKLMSFPAAILDLLVLIVICHPLLS